MPSVPSADVDPKLYDHILSVILGEIGKSNLLVRDVPKPPLFFEVEPAVQVQAGSGALALDMDMQEELVKAFLELLTSLKPAVSLSPYKVLRDLCWALF